MTIEYDSEKKRATHVETGLAVEFIEYGYMQDQNAYFNLIMGEKKNLRRSMILALKKFERLILGLMRWRSQKNKTS